MIKKPACFQELVGIIIYVYMILMMRKHYICCDNYEG